MADMQADPPLKPHTLGGQALIEGVMMRSPKWWAVAVRRPEGWIHTESHRVGTAADRRPWLGRPLIRGVVALGETLAIGMRALTISARHAHGEEGEEIGRREMGIALALALVMFVGLFIVLPAAIVPAGTEGSGTAVRNLLEGILRICILLAYILVVSLLPDIRRVFQYHGAEHKVIAAYEAGEEPSVESARKFSTIHIRCGTNFLFLVMLMAVLVFSLVGRPALPVRIASRVVLLPVVAALSYELLKVAARYHGNPLVRAITLPGLLLQRVTTRQPDDQQVEVALTSLQQLLEREDESASGAGPRDPEPTDTP